MPDRGGESAGKDTHFRYTPNLHGMCKFVLPTVSRFCISYPYVFFPFVGILLPEIVWSMQITQLK